MKDSVKTIFNKNKSSLHSLSRIYFPIELYLNLLTVGGLNIALSLNVTSIVLMISAFKKVVSFGAFSEILVINEQKKIAKISKSSRKMKYDVLFKIRQNFFCDLFLNLSMASIFSDYSLHDFITEVREAETPEEEKVIISSELANIRTKIKDSDTDSKPRLVAKLVFLSISGENTQWAQIESAGLMSHHRYSYKRIGYLAAQTFIDETSQMSVLLTQTILGDLQSTNPLIQALALSFIANKGTPELCQEVATEVNKLNFSVHPGIMKRAGAASVQIIRQVPELASTFKKGLTNLLGSSKHGVVSSGILLAMEMIKTDPTLYHSWSHFSKPFTKLFKDMSLSKPTLEFRMSTFNDPFLQIKAMQLLGLLKQPSDELDDALTALVTAIDSRRNTGRSLLFQAVDTIGLTAKKPSLYSLALNQIGRLLNIRQPNVLYSALSVFSKLLYNGQEIINRSSRESLALKRYKSQVVHCLDHRDSSIRRRALDVVLALVDETNVTTLIPEIIDYLHLAVDRDFRVEMVAKVYTSIQRFAPSPVWQFDTCHSLIIDSGNYIGSDILTSLCRLIATNEEVRNHALPLLSNTMSGFPSNQALVKIASWCLGEFAATFESTDNPNDQRPIQQRISDTIQSMIKIARMPQNDSETICYLLTSITKLASKLQNHDEVNEFLDGYQKSANVELQQRSGELFRLLQHPELWSTAFAPPDYKPLGNQEAQQPQQAKIVVNEGSTSSLIDVNDLNVDQGNNQSQLIQSHPTNQKDDIIDDLLDLGNVSTNTTYTTPGSAAAELNQLVQNEFKPLPGAVEAIRNADFAVYFEVQKNAANPKQVAIRVTIANLGLHPLNNFQIQYGVPVGWMVRAQPLNGNVLAVKGGAPLQQVLYLENRGNAPLMMKTHATYLFGSQPLTSDDVVNSSVFA